MNCDTNNLALLAKCFACLPPRTLLEVETLLLCRLVFANFHPH